MNTVYRNGVGDDRPDRERNAEEEICGGQGDKTPVIVVTPVGIGADDILEIVPSLHEGADSED